MGSRQPGINPQARYHVFVLTSEHQPEEKLLEH
jgi:hypothetical protein